MENSTVFVPASDNQLGLEIGAPTPVVQSPKLQSEAALLNESNTSEPNMTTTPPETESPRREEPGIDFTVVPSHEEASSLQDIARAVVSNQADRIYLRVRQCDIPTLILLLKVVCYFREGRPLTDSPHA